MKIIPIKSEPKLRKLSLPLYESGVSAGFPSPADDYVQERIDLNEYLIKHPAATFFAWANGDSLIDIGIKDKDLMIVDRSLKAKQGDVVVVALDGDLTCKLLDKKNKRLLAANNRYPPIELTSEMELLIEGVVANSIRHHRVRAG